MAELPDIEALLAEGREDEARATVRRKDFPECREADTWILDLWYQTHCQLAQGSQMDLLRFHCEAEGLTSKAAQMEVWERLLIVEGAVLSHRAAMEKARAYGH